MSGKVKKTVTTSTVPTSTVLSVTTPQEFYNVINNTEKKYVFVDFYATWCGPCMKFAPTLNKLSLEYNKHVDFLKVNIESEAGEVCDIFKIESLPTFLIFKKGDDTKPFSKPIIGTSADFKGILALLNKDPLKR